MGKCRSEIHASLKKTSDTRQTGPRYLSPIFLLKNQLFIEGPELTEVSKRPTETQYLTVKLCD